MAALANQILEIARVLRLSVIAEGIESEDQADLLRRMRCELGQGFGFGRPMDHEVIARLRARELTAAPGAMSRS